MAGAFGLSDLPLKKQSEDILGLSPYVKGLAHFIRRCPTPMSIALQGDWGTGKTSLLFQLQDELTYSPAPVKCIYFNTWQYSQFNMAQDLYSSFLHTLTDKLSMGDKTAEAQKKAMLDALKFLSFRLTKQFSGIDPQELINAVKTKEDQTRAIARLRAEFAALVAACVHSEQKRLVVLIDDLDRLRPDIAVELLEVIKLFLDVPHCVFVLAVDYNVVVSGVRRKFGTDLSEEKCRAFFDKMIQLPFRMPVESYQMEALVQDGLGSYIRPEHIGSVSKVVEAALGPNPRAFKRLANSFFLIHSVLNYRKDSSLDTDEQTRNSLIFCALALQLSLPHVYSALLTLPDCFDDRISSLLHLFVADQLSYQNITDTVPQQEEDMPPFQEDSFDALPFGEDGWDIPEDIIPLATFIRMLDFDSETIRRRYLSFSGISDRLEPGEWERLAPTVSALDSALHTMLPGPGFDCYDLFAKAVSLSAITGVGETPSSL